MKSSISGTAKKISRKYLSLKEVLILHGACKQQTPTEACCFCLFNSDLTKYREQPLHGADRVSASTINRCTSQKQQR